MAKLTLPAHVLSRKMVARVGPVILLDLMLGERGSEVQEVQSARRRIGLGEF